MLDLGSVFMVSDFYVVGQVGWEMRPLQIV